jgi:hypothetical protein
MKIRLEQGKRYRARVNRSIGSPFALSAVHQQMTASGFKDVKLVSVKGGTEVTATWDQATAEIDVAFDVAHIQQVTQ